MVSLPEPVIRIIKHPESNKVMATVSPDGKPHVIACGSLRMVDDDTIVVGDALMSRTTEFLEKNPEVEFLVWMRKDAYSIKARLVETQETGPVYHEMALSLSKINLTPRCVLLFDVEEVWDESASSTAGSKVV
jgi:predicted pyridoxine 5'-phosphate oxidase superfamily flavin-nucleotide-binding protein